MFRTAWHRWAPAAVITAYRMIPVPVRAAIPGGAGATSLGGLHAVLRQGRGWTGLGAAVAEWWQNAD